MLPTTGTPGNTDRVLRPMIVAKQLDLAQSITDYSVTQQVTSRTNLTKELDKYNRPKGDTKINSVALVSNNTSLGVVGSVSVVSTNSGVVLSKVKDGEFDKSNQLVKCVTPMYYKPAPFGQYSEPQPVKSSVSNITATPVYRYDTGHSPINLSTKEIQNETLDLSVKKSCVSTATTALSHGNATHLINTVSDLAAAIGCQDEPMDFSTSQRSATPIPTVRVANPFEQEPIKQEPIHFMHGQPLVSSKLQLYIYM